MINERGSHPAALYIALTSRDITGESSLLEELKDLPVGMKVGLELFVREGPDLLERIREYEYPVFLDLKFHDIPFTVAGAVRSACAFAPELLNVHATGGREMMLAAAQAAAEFGGRTRIIAVTVLTSLSGEDLSSMGIGTGPGELVERLALSAQDAGLDGVVCSPMEARAVRSATGPEFMIVTPGIRPAGGSTDDQKRTSTPAQAVAMGADSLVVGRPVTAAPSPREAAMSILREIREAGRP